MGLPPGILLYLSKITAIYKECLYPGYNLLTTCLYTPDIPYRSYIYKGFAPNYGFKLLNFNRKGDGRA